MSGTGLLSALLFLVGQNEVTLSDSGGLLVLRGSTGILISQVRSMFVHNTDSHAAGQPMISDKMFFGAFAMV